MPDCVLSVSVAAYNVEKYINETLQAFVDADVPEGMLEVIVINDGSKDKTRDIAREFELKYPYLFKLCDKQNGGWGSTVNLGLDIAQGKYFKQLDGDDYYDKNNIKRFIEYLSDSNADLVISPFRAFSDGDGEILYDKRFDALKDVKERDINECISEYAEMCMHAACFRTQTIKNKIAITEHCFYTDIELMVKAIDLCKTVSYFENTIYCYRTERQGQSMSVEGLLRHYKEHGKISLILAEYCTNVMVDSSVREIVKARVVSMIDYHYGILFMLKERDLMKRELKDYDLSLRKYKLFYKKVRSKKVKLLRVTGFGAFPIVYKMAKRSAEKSE